MKQATESKLHKDWCKKCVYNDVCDSNYLYCEPQVFNQEQLDYMDSVIYDEKTIIKKDN